MHSFHLRRSAIFDSGHEYILPDATKLRASEKYALQGVEMVIIWPPEAVQVTSSQISRTFQLRTLSTVDARPISVLGDTKSYKQLGNCVHRKSVSHRAVAGVIITWPPYYVDKAPAK